MNKGEIIFCSRHLRTEKNKKHMIKEVVFSRRYDEEVQEILSYKRLDHKKIIDKLNLKEDLIIEKIDKIKSLGYKNKSSSYTKATQNDNNSRNKITGAYE